MDERSIRSIAGHRSRRTAAVAAVVLPLAGVLCLATPVSAQLATADEPNLTAVGSGQASGAAETARIQFLVGVEDPFGDPFEAPPFEEEGAEDDEGTPAAAETEGGDEEGVIAGGSGPATIAEEDLEPMLEVIEGAGVAREAIEINTGPSVGGLFGPGGPGTALVEFVVEQPETDGVNTLVTDAIAAGTEAGLFLQHAGVEYDVADCSALIQEARVEAVADAREQAEGLATAAGVTLGGLIQVSDYGFFGGPVEPDDDGCPPSPQNVFYGSESLVDTPPFDPTAEAEAEAYSSVNLAFAITEDGA